MKVLAQQVSHDLKHPQDKRRFGRLIEVQFFTSLKSELKKKADIVILNIHSDMSLIQNLKKNGVIIVFDYCDMIHMRNIVSFYLMTILWWIKGKISYPMTRGKFKKILASVDILVVGSIPQKDLCSNFRNGRIEIIEDYFPELSKKINPNSDIGKSGLMWEGLAGGNLKIIYKCFRIAKKAGLDLVLVTDEFFPLFSGFVKIPISKVLYFLSRISNNYQFTFYKWNMSNLILCSNECEFMLIPLNPNNKLENFKPSNKAALGLRLGLKPILYHTPDYQILSDIICEDESICFKDTERAVYLTKNYPNYDKKSLNKYLNSRNKVNLKAKWEKIIN